MAFPGILRRLFENEGAGPLLRPNLFRQTNYTTTLTTSGNWTVPYDGYYLEELLGGGGGGGSLLKTSGTAIGVFACGGGASGEYISIVKYHKRGAIVSATIGSGGNKGDTPSDGKGYSGGNTTFDGTIAQGGNGGAGYVDFSDSRYSAGYGGSPNGAGAHGGNAMVTNMSQSTGISATLYSGAGGDSMFGEGGRVKYISNTGSDGFAAGDAGTGYGSGGSGGAGNNKTAYGGKGAPGCVRITYLGV